MLSPAAPTPREATTIGAGRTRNARPAPKPTTPARFAALFFRGAPPQLIGLFFFFNPSCCSMYDSPFVIQSGAGSPFR